MSTGLSTAHSVVEPTPLVRRIAGFFVIAYALITLTPLVWIGLTSIKSPPDSIAYPPKVLPFIDFDPTIEGYCNLFTTRSRQTAEYLATVPPPSGACEELARSRSLVVAGPSNYVPRFLNSVVIAFGSTFFAVLLGTLAAYAFSRFKVPLKDDLMFFILSTRMMPPIAVAIPIFLMYRELGLSDTRLGMILLYTSVNVSLAVWLLKGFIDEIPREYEEAAMIDGYTRLQAFVKVVLPQAATGIAATAIFCLIFAWNEYAFAVLLTSGTAQTAPPFIPIIIGEGGQDWPAVAAGTTLFLIPIVAFTILLRKQLLRDIAFVFQLFALYPHMNVRRNIGFPLTCEGVPRAEIRRRVEETARILRIDQLLDRSVSGLSGGDLQRVALGRAIVRQPKAFLMDEPLGVLDTELREAMIGELRALHMRLRATTVYVTHDQLEAMAIADRIAVMNHGVVEQVGHPRDIYDRPATRFVADFIGSPPMNFLSVRTCLAPGQSEILVGGVPVTVPPLREAVAESDLVLGVRPEHVRLDDGGGIRAQVYGAEYLGTTQIVTLRTGHGMVKARLPSSSPVRVGETVGIAFRPEKLSLFDAATGRALRTALHDAAALTGGRRHG